MKFKINLTPEDEAKLIRKSLMQSYFDVMNSPIFTEEDGNLLKSLIDVIQYHSTPDQFKKFQNKIS